MRNAIPALAATIVIATLAASAQAAITPLSLPGNTEVNTWTTTTLISPTGYGSFPGNSAWPGVIASQQAGASIAKTGNSSEGGPFVAGESVYVGGFSFDNGTYGGQLSFSDSTPVANLKNVALQVEAGAGFGNILFPTVSGVSVPTLSYNNGTQALVPTIALLTSAVDTGQTGGPFNLPIQRQTYLLQWDLSAIAAPITSYSVAVNFVQHSQLYAARLDASDVFAVPEPAAASVLALPLLALRRRR